MQIVPKAIDEYLDSLVPEQNSVFHDMEKLALEKNFPYVGPQVGALLAQLARMIDAKRIIELGSGFGYSAAWFLSGTSPDATIMLTDFDKKNLERAEEFLGHLGYTDQIDCHTGDAIDVFRTTTDSFDIVFSDIDKEHYPEVIALAEQRLRSGGLLITDNALWHGKVVDEEKDEATSAVFEFNCQLASHASFDTVVLPLRDGVSVARKR